MKNKLENRTETVYNITMADKTQDNQETNDHAAPLPGHVDREIPLDTKLLSEAVIELNISRKNVSIYPPGHIQITKSIDRAFELLQRLFEIRLEMTLGVAKDTLLVGQDYLDRQNPVYRDFALSLNQQEVASVTFIRGLDKEELVRFHRILTTKPDDIRGSGGIDKVMAASSIPHIRIQAMDYSRFHLTEEQEIFRPQQVGAGGGRSGEGRGGVSRMGVTRAGDKSGSGVWQDFVSNLVSGTIASPDQGGLSLADATHIDPAELARLLNERKLDPGAALVSYDRIISNHVRGAAEKKSLTEEQSSTLANMNTLLKDLHPDLRKQFLSVAFRHAETGHGAEEIVGGLAENLVIEMLEQASSEGREISPTLTGLINNLTRVQDSVQITPQFVRDARKAEGLLMPDILPEHMRNLFDREEYEKYVSTDYSEMLKRLSETSATVHDRIPVDEYEKTLEDDHLDFQIGRALLAFLEEEIEEEDYREFARKLVTIAPELFKTGNFALLLDMLDTLRRHARDKPVEGIRACADESIKIFSDPAFRTQAVVSFDGWARTKGKEAASLLLALGPEIIPELLDIYAIDTGPGGRRIVFNLLCNFGQATVKEAMKRLRDPRAYYVRNLVMLIRWTGNSTSVPTLKLLLNHQDQKVRMEVLTALLKFKDASGLPLLRTAIRSHDPDLSSQAISLAGQYRIAEVLDDILAMMKKVILFEDDYTINEEIIKALGDIGDPRVIPELEKIARATLRLYPARFAKLKISLFESLGRYPRESISGLLKIGEKTGVEKIRKACRKLMENR